MDHVDISAPEESKKAILLGSLSRCHGSRSIIVRSRPGGFVTQNCEVCHRPRALRLDEIPPLNCQLCGNALNSFHIPWGNYAYECRNCRRTTEVASIVPHWDELFDYHGYAIEKDYIVSLQQLNPEQLRALLQSLHSGGSQTNR